MGLFIDVGVIFIVFQLDLLDVQLVVVQLDKGVVDLLIVFDVLVVGKMNIEWDVYVVLQCLVEGLWNNYFVNLLCVWGSCVGVGLNE